MNTILRQHMMGVKLPVELYDECVVATKDDSEQVRLIAIELVWAISSAYPEYPVVINRYKVSETIRLLDDAFVKICDMVNDNSVIVRQRACTILGRFKDVDSKFLSQTFSKQVMSNLRRYVPRGMRESTRRNQGIKTRQIKPSNIPTPEGDVDVESDEFKLLDSGAAGAFVHGLEDEFQEVRDAAIESITELSVNSTEFAAKAVDFLVDMFNDSSDSVRLRAIHALLSIGERALIQLTDEQLSIALSAMKDANSTVRKGIYAFLAVSVLAKSEWLAELMAAIKASLEKYPEDQLAIYKATKSLGFNHSAIVSVPFVRGLLGLSEHYLSREARIDDIVYAGKVILIMNTKPQTRQLLAPALPEFVFNHLPYLRDKYVGCLPENISDSVPAKFGFVKQMLKRPAVSPTISQLSANDDSERLSKAQASIRETLAKISSKSHSAEDAANHTLPSMLGLLTRQIQKLDDLKQSQTTVSTDHSAGATESYARVIADVLRIQSLAGNQLRQTETLDIASRIMLNWTLEWSEVPVLLPLSSGEETSVEISIAVECKADVPWSDHFVVEGEIVPASYAAESYYKAAAAPDLRHVRIVISNQSHKVSVNPVQFRPPQTSQTRA
ncbi:hypothetical protein GGI12_001622 [Dipsacomyces acuminosporus]|nr:hypothetical protein GGI12_001622 [Dipsacomyces acuminosporus]